MDWECPTLAIGQTSTDIQPDTVTCQAPKPGQLQSLYHHALHNNVKAVVVAVGADDFNFSDITKKCMDIYIEQHAVDDGTRCYNQDVIETTFGAFHRARVEQRIFRFAQKPDDRDGLGRLRQE